MGNNSSLFQHSGFLQKTCTRMLVVDFSPPKYFFCMQQFEHSWWVRRGKLNTCKNTRCSETQRLMCWLLRTHTRQQPVTKWTSGGIFYSLYEFLQLKEESICYGTPKLLVFFIWYMMNAIVYFCLVYMLESIFICWKVCYVLTKFWNWLPSYDP